MYINSNNIDIFPLSKPRVNKSSRLFYEENVTNLIRQIVDIDSFIIEGPEKLSDSGKLDKDLIFNLFGYYFKIISGTDLSDISSQNGNYIIGEIELDKSNPDIPFELKGQDDTTSNTFTGINITNVESLPTIDDVNKHFLVLFKKSGNEWLINDDSYKKFNSQSFNISGIDGKH